MRYFLTVLAGWTLGFALFTFTYVVSPVPTCRYIKSAHVVKKDTYMNGELVLDKKYE